MGNMRTENHCTALISSL